VGQDAWILAVKMKNPSDGCHLKGCTQLAWPFGN
jgi:hypothetical protein